MKKKKRAEEIFLSVYNGICSKARLKHNPPAS